MTRSDRILSTATMALLGALSVEGIFLLVMLVRAHGLGTVLGCAVPVALFAWAMSIDARAEAREEREQAAGKFSVATR